MVNDLARTGNGLIAKAGKRRPEPSLLSLADFPRPSRAPGNYGKNTSIRIDNVTEQIGARSLTTSAKLLKNNAALSVTNLSRFLGNGASTAGDGDRSQGLEWGVPQALRGLFRVGA